MAVIPIVDSTISDKSRNQHVAVVCLTDCGEEEEEKDSKGEQG